MSRRTDRSASRNPHFCIRIPVYLLMAWCLTVGSLGLTFAQPADQAPATVYRLLSIAEPAEGQTVFDNRGDVSVRIELTPDLRVTVGDRLMLSVDERAATPVKGTKLQLHALERGAHTLQARVLDRSGHVLISSAPVTFYLWQASALFPNRKK